MIRDLLNDLAACCAHDFLVHPHKNNPIGKFPSRFHTLQKNSPGSTQGFFRAFFIPSTFFCVQKPFPYPEIRRSNFQQLIFSQILNCLIQRHFAWCFQADFDIFVRLPHIGQMFFLANIDHDLICFLRFANNHAFINICTGIYKKNAALFCIFQTICCRDTRFPGND